MKGDVYKRNVDTRDNLLACILDGAARISVYQGCHLNIKLKQIKLIVGNSSFFVTVYNAFVFVDSNCSTPYLVFYIHFVFRPKHVAISCNKLTLLYSKVVVFELVVIFILNLSNL